MKVCIRCKEEKPTDAFGKLSSRPDGLHYYCKECKRQGDRDRHAKDPSVHREAGKVWYQNNKDRLGYKYKVERHGLGPQMDSVRKRRALMHGVEAEHVVFEVVFERDEGTCQICMEEREGKWSLDHRVPLARGGSHTYDNVQLAHLDCNLRKGVNV